MKKRNHDHYSVGHADRRALKRRIPVVIVVIGMLFLSISETANAQRFTVLEPFGADFRGAQPVASRDGRFTKQRTLPSGDEQLWVNDENGTHLVIEAGGNYENIIIQGSGGINSHGRIVFTGETATRQENVLIAGGQQTVFAYEGQPAPGLPGITFKHSVFGASLRDNGYVVFPRTLSDDSYSYWIGPYDDYQLLMRTEQPAPGIPGALVETISVVANHSGYSTIKGDTTAGLAVWAGVPGDVQLVVAANTPAPGTNGLEFDSLVFLRETTTEDNRTVFTTGLLDPGTGDHHGDGLWFGQPGDLQLQLGPDSETPVGQDFRYSSFQRLHVNSSNQAVMPATVISETFDPLSLLLGFELGSPDTPAILASSGDPAPGTQSIFTGFGFGDVNDNGEILVRGGAAGVGPGYWIADSDGELHLVVHEGQWIDVLPGPGQDLRQIRRFGLVSEFTNDGSFATDIIFEDGSRGIFIGRLVPEPASLHLAWLTALAGAAMRLRTRS